MLASCNFSQIPDILDEDARVACNISDNINKISEAIEITSSKYGFSSSINLDYPDTNQFASIMSRGPASIHIRNFGRGAISINSSFTPVSENDEYSGEDIDFIVDDLVSRFIRICTR